MDLPLIRTEIEKKPAGRPATAGDSGSASVRDQHSLSEELLARMLAKVDQLCVEREGKIPRHGQSFQRPDRAALPLITGAASIRLQTSAWSL
jgi:hypothetical protein